MSATGVGVSRVDRDALRAAIADKYAQVATTPELGFHFLTGRAVTVFGRKPTRA
jgi:hypothetical protein